MAYRAENICEMLIPINIHYGLRSQDDLTFVVRRTKRKTLGDWALRVAAPTLGTHHPKMCIAAMTLAF